LDHGDAGTQRFSVKNDLSIPCVFVGLPFKKAGAGSWVVFSASPPFSEKREYEIIKMKNF
jgi:hypothetical protein